MILQPNGRPAASQVDIPLSRMEMQRLADAEAVMQKYGLSMFCTRCHGLGLPDGVRMQNETTKREKVISCGCTVRKYVGDLMI